MRRLALTFVVLFALALPTTAAARIRLVRITSPINHGAYATLT